MIRQASTADIDNLAKLFAATISAHPDYISHGEIQMGIAIDTQHLYPQFSARWMNYLKAQMTDFPDGIWIYEVNGCIEGFIIFMIDEDLYKPFGVINDLCVTPTHRETGIGSELLDFAIKNLEEKGIADFYLESGIENHLAHSFFEKRGFKAVSKIFRKTKDL